MNFPDGLLEWTAQFENSVQHNVPLCCASPVEETESKTGRQLTVRPPKPIQ